MALFWRGTATNWSDNTGWSTTDGGGSAGAIPTAADDVNFTANGNGTNCTLDTAVAKVAKTLTINGYTGTLTFNVQLSVSGSITFTTTGFTFAGSSANKLRMIAAGTWTTNGKTVAPDVEIGGTTTFTCTLAGTLTIDQNLTLTNTTSTIFAGSFNISAGAGITVSGSQTITMSGNITGGGLTTISDANVINGAFSWTCAGLTTTLALTGTVTIHLTAGGTWQGAGACSCSVSVDGDTTMSGTVLYAASGTPTLTLNGGGLTGSGVLSIASACTIVGHATKGISNITITAAITLTINTNVLLISGTLTTPNAATTFGGNVGFTAGTLANTTIAASAKTYTLTQGNTYQVTAAMGWTGATAALTLTITSSHATNKTTFTLDKTATQSCGFVNATRLDSSLGQVIFSYSGTLTTTFGWSNAIAKGNLTPTAGGETVAVSGVTYDKSGVILGSCVVNVFMDNGDNTSTYVGTVTSNASTGAWSLSVLPRAGAVYFARAYKGGGTPVMDATGLLTAA